jgi:molybdenum cofactor cytidylyltransferase
MTQEIWAIVLAAGKSTRMKKQKLLLPFDGETIIRRVLKIVVDAFNNNVVVVLGSHSDEIREAAGYNSLRYCINNEYEDGMLSSVICGFGALPEGTAAALIFLSDQPHIPAAVTMQLIDAWRNSKKGIIIPTYEGRRGHPVLIETKYKHIIGQLDKNKGLRSLMDQYSSDVFEMECRASEIVRDIDTPEDYQFEINKYK